MNVQVIVDTHHFSPPPLSLDRGVSAISIKEFNSRVGLGKHFIKFHGSRSLALFYFILFYFILIYFIFVAVKLVTVAFFFFAMLFQSFLQVLEVLIIFVLKMYPEGLRV